MDFERVVQAMFGGKSRKIKPSERQARIDRLVSFVCEGSSSPGIAEKLFGRRSVENSTNWIRHGAERDKATELIDRWVRDGIPEPAYVILKHHFSQWWEYKVATQNSKNRKGKRAVKGSDGRRGARPPDVFEKLIFSQKKHLTHL